MGLLMLQLRPQSLALVSAYGLADSAAQVLAGAAVGSYLSRCSLVCRTCGPAAICHIHVNDAHAPASRSPASGASGLCQLKWCRPFACV